MAADEEESVDDMPEDMSFIPGVNLDILAQQMEGKEAFFTGPEMVKRMEHMLKLENQAARRIQRAWFAFRDRKLFHYYKDLIAFHEHGDPAAMLRSINPTEAALMDAATPVRVRFRLGGALFPPTVYYKIFTAGLVDLNSLAPRDYTAAFQPTMKELHLKPTSSPGSTPTLPRREAGWYQRVENNAWRPVTDKAFLSMENSVPLNAPAQVSLPPKRLPGPEFHWKSGQRAADRKAAERRKRVEWMKKLYLGRVEEQFSDDGSEVEALRAETEEVGRVLEGDPNDDELEALVEWTQGLDFADYHSHWLSIGTTWPSGQDPGTIVPRPVSTSATSRTSSALDDDLTSTDTYSLPDYTHRKELAQLSAGDDKKGSPFITQDAGSMSKGA